MVPTRGNLAVYGLIAALTIISLIILFRLRQQFDANLQGRVADLQRVFSNRNLLKGSADFKITFSEIEAEAAKYENRGDFGAIQIAKRFKDRQHTIYPFYLPAYTEAGLPLPSRLVIADADSWWNRIFNYKMTKQLPLIADGEQLGLLSVEVNYGALRTVSLVIWALAATLAASLTFLATHLRRQEIVISATTVELEEKRRELVRLERLALAGQLSANILHDLKKPVLNIRNEADEALHPPHGFSPDTPQTIFQRVREQADFFLTVLREGGFDRFVRAREEREYVDINDLLDRSLALVRYEQGSVEIIRHFDPQLPPVLAEPARLIQVFSNLILNACQAMEGRGKLVLTSSTDNEHDIKVTVSDTGPGIPASLLPRIFEPFYTTKPAGQGTGLGLYIVRDILQELGGSITLNSEPDGTTFCIKLPASS